MTVSEAIEKLKLEGGLEISGKPKRVAEFFEALSVAGEVLEEWKTIKSDGFTDHLLNMGYTKGMKDGYVKGIDACIETCVKTNCRNCIHLDGLTCKLKGDCDEDGVFEDIMRALRQLKEGAVDV